MMNIKIAHDVKNYYDILLSFVHKLCLFILLLCINILHYLWTCILHSTEALMETLTARQFLASLRSCLAHMMSSCTVSRSQERKALMLSCIIMDSVCSIYRFKKEIMRICEEDIRVNAEEAGKCRYTAPVLRCLPHPVEAGVLFGPRQPMSESFEGDSYVSVRMWEQTLHLHYVIYYYHYILYVTAKYAKYKSLVK